MLPVAMESEGTTVVIVPYRSLADDLVKRCSNLGLEAVEWTMEEQVPARIVIGITERCFQSVNLGVHLHQTFLEFVAGLHQAGQLKRIVIDECHTLVTESKFRSAIANTFHLRAVPVPMIFTTATLPPSIIDEFEDTMALKDSPIRYIRASSFRSNIKVKVVRCGNGKGITTALQLAKQRVESLKTGEKVVIFCRSRSKAEMLGGSSLLNCPMYYGGMSDEERSENLQRWQEPSEVFLIATTAFGCGVDIPGIVSTFHVNSPYTLVDFVQESGRGGRHGERSSATIIIEERELTTQITKSGFQGENELALQQFLSTRRCRNQILSGFLDGGEGWTCAQAQAELCDNCESSSIGQVGPKAMTSFSSGKQVRQEVSEGQRAVAKKISSTRTGFERFKELVERVGYGKDRLCPVCYVLYSESLATHDFGSCSKNVGLSFEEIVKASYSIKWPSHHGICWRCGLPEEICGEAKKVKAERSECQNKWAVVSIAIAIQSATGEIRKQALALALALAGGRDEFKEFNYLEWLGKKHDKRIHGFRATNALAIVDILVRNRL